MKIKGLTIIFLITLMISFWINFIDLKFPVIAFFANKAKNLEDVINNLCLSYISGYIFYLLNVYSVELKEKKAILPYVALNISFIINRNQNLIRILYQNQDLQNYYPKKNEFENLLKNVKIDELNIYNYQNKTFLEFLKLNRKSTIKNINKVLNSDKYVDEDLKIILLSLKESLFLKKDYAFNSNDFDLLKMVKYHNVFFKFFEDLQKLDIYYSKYLIEYYYLNYPNHYVERLKKDSKNPF